MGGSTVQARKPMALDDDHSELEERHTSRQINSSPSKMFHRAGAVYVGNMFSTSAFVLAALQPWGCILQVPFASLLISCCTTCCWFGPTSSHMHPPQLQSAPWDRQGGQPSASLSSSASSDSGAFYFYSAVGGRLGSCKCVYSRVLRTWREPRAGLRGA